MRPALRLFTQLRVPRLTLYSGGPECSLCEVAKEALDELRAKTDIPPFELEIVNIRRNLPELKRWRRLYQYDIPVLHLNGQEVMKHRLDQDKLGNLLRSAASSARDESSLQR